MVLDKTLLSFLLSSPPPSFSPASIYNLANTWLTDSPGGTWQAASVEAGCFPTAAASAGQVRPLAPGTFDCLSRNPALLRAPPSRHSRGWEGGGLCGNPASAWAVLLLFPRPGQPGCQCVIHRVGAHAACFSRVLPSSAMPEVFPQPWRGALTEGWGPRLCFLHIPAGPSPPVVTGPCPPHPALWVTSEQTSLWLAWGWENFTNIRT